MKLKCNNCKKEQDVYLTPKIVPIQERFRSDNFAPKYTVMIKATCFECDKYIKFVKQTPEIIDEVNKTFGY